MANNRSNLPPFAIIRNWHVAMFFDGSVKTYVTKVVPIPKTDPGVCVLFNKVTFPDSSTAKGSVQDTDVPVEPISTSAIISDGQFVTSGALLSTEMIK